MKKKFSVVLFLLLLSLFLFSACGYAYWEISGSGSDIQANETDTQDSSAGTGSAEDGNADESIKTYVRATLSLKIRSDANASSASLGTINSGDMLAYISQSAGFYKVWFRGGEAYVSASYSELHNMAASEKYEAVISVAEKLLGTPYVYGAVRLHDGAGNLLSGFDMDKFDCSSFVQYAFYLGDGTLLNLTTRTQSVQGAYVSKADIERGTVLFFTNSSRFYNTGVERIGHVGIYLGDNFILHTASDYAVIEKISAVRWSYFITARNM